MSVIAGALFTLILVGRPTAEERKAFCDQVFAKDVITKLYGVPLETNRNAGRRGPRGMMECEHKHQPKGEMYPKLIVKLVVDCRAYSQNIELTKRAMQATDEKTKTFEEISLGKWGGYVHRTMKMARMEIPVFQVAFLHDGLPCSVNVFSSFSDNDEIRKVAKHVYGKLTAKNVPLVKPAKK